LIIEQTPPDARVPVVKSVSCQAWYRNTGTVQVVTMTDEHHAPAHSDNGSLRSSSSSAAAAAVFIVEEALTL